MSQEDGEVRIHWPLNDGRAACLADGPDLDLDDDATASTPFCGACLVVLMFLRVHSEELWDGLCAPPADRPSAALAQLAATPWAQLFATDRPLGADTWWFETEEEDR